MDSQKLEMQLLDSDIREEQEPRSSVGSTKDANLKS